ncbi:hypothetical protein GGS23DRAFT_588843 [Durotheca rogersii]|uniref:uncharacterized protein n=1 Tax=Durotheca rogersii TaxID=419775 RepID=UPI00222113B3|nr:uncharacterized protein GGS23DRAFT_588843 [Durotheca rogersii]KAI5856715.1 hypothetical protein GGS23DRAFT_588843 [Durotheca rogersii]
MAWELSSQWSPRWSLSQLLLFTRLLQASGTLVTAIMNGFLLAYVHLNRLGLANSMFCLEMMICVAFIYSSIVLLMQHVGSRRQRTSTTLIAVFVVGDLMFNGLTIAIITLLARAGLPSDCHGLTRTNVEPGDAPDLPREGFDTIRFGNKERGEKGQLDRYCSMERGFYCIAVALVFTYTITVVLAVLRIFERRWTGQDRLHTFASVDNVYRLDHVGSKVNSPSTGRAPENLEPSTEGVMPAPRTSPILRIPPVVVPSGGAPGPRVPHGQAQSEPFPVSPVSAASPTSQVSPISTVARHHTSFASSAALDASIGGLMVNHTMESTAEAAMITDGYRHPPQPGMPSLPPYSPGQSQGRLMVGHGDESNEIRLSGYVKGETRAQEMKDSGHGI